MSMKTKSNPGRGRIIFALILLFIPAVNIVDVFPDFIAYFILAGVLSWGVNKAPYFEEAKASFFKLGIINMLRIPALLFMNLIRMGNQSDTDIFALTTLVFAIVETICLLPAITNIFNALFYLGERSDAEAPIKSIYLVGKLELSANTVKTTSYFFAVSRAVLALIPELFLMTTVSKEGSNLSLHSNAKFYPPAFLICFSLSLIIGVIWFIITSKYTCAISKENKFYSAIDSLVTDKRRPEIEKKQRLQNICTALNTMIFASVFTLEINFDNFGDMNILPHFIFPVVLLFGLYRLTKETKYTRVASVAIAAHTAVSLTAHILLIIFLENWQYTEIKLIREASKAYMPVVVLSVAEFVLLSVIIVTEMLAMRQFILNNTKISPKSENYAVPDKDFHRSLLTKGVIHSIIALLVGASKMMLVFLNGGSDYLYVGTSDGNITTVITTAIPWFEMFMTFIAFSYIGFSVYYFGIIKDEVKMKYQ